MIRILGFASEWVNVRHRSVRAARAAVACFVPVLAVVVLGGAVEALAQGEPVTFSVTGDYPYDDSEVAILQRHVDDHNLYSPSDFFVHVGDVFAQGVCAESLYTRVADVLIQSEVPVFMTPGDNEWTDCSDEDQAWLWWEASFMLFDDNFCSTFPIEHQSVRPENFAFVDKGVLFAGVNLPNGNDSNATQRIQDNADWIATQFSTYGSQVRAAVVFGQAGPGGNRDVFFDQLVQSALAFGKPVMYAMGDEHSWTLDYPFAAPNIIRMVVARGGSEDPVQVTATMDPLNPWDILRNPWDNNPPPVTRPPCGSGSVVINDVQVLEPDSGTSPAWFRISLQGGDGTQFTVDWATAPGTADADVDYVSKSGTITLPGPNGYQDVLVPVRGDWIYEEDETYFVNLSNATNGAIIGKPQGVGTILNDDPAPFYDLSVSATGMGSILLEPPGGNYVLGTWVKTTGFFSPGWAFDHWSGDLTGTANPDSILMDGDKTIMATFVPNDPPVAAGEAYTTDEDSPLTVAAPGLVANDWDPDGDPVTAVPGIDPTNGTLLLNLDGSFTYTPNANFFGRDGFTYLAHDGRGAYDSAAVTIDVAPINDAPVVVGDTYSTDVDVPLTISPPGVLGNDSEVEGELFTALPGDPPWRGFLTLNPDGSFTYDPFPGYAGVDTFTYRATDGSATSGDAIVTVEVGLPQPIVLAPLEDSYIKSSNATGNFGLATGLRVRGGTPWYDAYLKFEVQGVSTVASAKLRLYVTNSGTDGGTVYSVSNDYLGTATPWEETGLTASNAPALTGPTWGSFGVVTQGQWVELDLSAAVTQEGIFSFGLQGSNDNSTWYSSKEGSAPPELVIQGYPRVPDIAASPGSHDYGSLLLGTGASRVFVIRNDGTGDLTLSGSAVQGPAAAEYTITAGGGGPFTLVPDATHSMTVSFDPVNLGPRIATLRVTSDDPDEGFFDIALSGTGIEPDIAVTPPTDDFGGIRLGLTSSHTFQVRNEGTANLSVAGATIEGVDAVEFGIVSGDSAVMLAPGDSAAIEVRFSPTTLGAKSAILRVTSDDPDENPADVPLAGEGILPDIAVTPPADDWGDVLLGDVANRTFTVRNEGTDVLAVTAVTLEGPEATDFAIVAGDSGFALAPAESAFVEVAFAPTLLGPRSATLRLASDDPDENPLDVPLSGTGVQPDIAVDPALHGYGDLLVGSSRTQSFAVRNDGTGPLDVTTVTLEGAGAAEFGILSGDSAFTLAPTETLSIDVAFLPTVPGSAQAILRLASTDPDENPLDVALTGNGVVPDITVTPASDDWGDVVVSTSASRWILVRNDGQGDLFVTSASVVGADSTMFAVVAGAGPFQLAPADSLPVEVVFTPAVAGSARTVLRIVNSDPDEDPVDVPLAGNGIEPDIAVDPTLHDYGDVLVAASASRAFTVRNEGTADLSVSATTIEGTDAAEFGFVSGGGSFTLIPGDSTSIEISFDPATLGAKTAALRLASDDLDESVLDVPLTGTGVLPDIAVDPTSSDWGDLLRGTSGTRSFLVRNEGTAPLAVTAATIEGPDAAEFALVAGDSGFVLAPAESASVIVSFEPATLGPKTATLRLLNDDPDESPLDVPLAGRSVEPDIAAAPGSEDWGDLLVGLTASRTFVVRNDGTSDLAVTATTIEGLDPAEFGIVAGAAPFTLAAAESATVEVIFSPTSLGPKSALLRLASDDPDENPLDVPLAGTGVQPDITAEPGSHDYGDVVLGTGSSRTFVIRNDGTADLAVSATTIEGVDAADFGITTGGGAFTLIAGDSASIELSFAPTTLGPKTAALRLASDDPDENPLDVALAGRGVQPDIAAVPSSEDWGDVLVGAASPRTFVIRNEGTSDLSVSATTIEGLDAAEFGITTGGGAFTLIAGDSASLDVSFAPISLGPKSAALRLASDDPDENPLDVPLAGTGVLPDIAVDPASRDWGDVRRGTSIPASFVVRNEGTADLTVSATTILGVDAADFVIGAGGGPFTLAPADSASIDVSFAPASLGLETASLRLTSDDPDEGIVDVPLVGTGVEPDVAVDPTSWDAGNVVVSQSTSRTFVVRNEGTSDLAVTATTIEGLDAADFGILTGAAPFTLAAAESATVDVSFAPGSPGAKSATLRVATDDPDEAQVDVPLDGIGVEPDIAVEPGSEDWGDVLVAANVSRSFVVRNEGTSDLNVSASTLEGPNAADFAILTGAAPFTLAPAESATVEVSFSPAALGPRGATLRFASDDLDENPLDVALAGRGVQPDIATTPASEDWGDVLLGAATSRFFVIRNEGTADLAVTATTLEGPDAAEFAIVTGGGAFTLVAGDSASIEVSFAPTALGPKSATLRLASDDPDENPLDVPLAGRGVLPDIAITPPADHGNVLVGSSVSRSFVVLNEGTAPLTVTATTILGVDAADFGIVAGGAPFTLAPAESASVDVSFSPSSLGPKTATLRVASDDPDESVLDLALAGAGVEPDVTVTPAAWDYGDVRVAATASRTFVVRNDGTADLAVTATTLEGPDAAEFAIVTGGGAFTLVPADSVTIGVDFGPTSLGPKAATLRLVSDDPDEGQVGVALAGTGVDPDIAADPSSHDYGDLLLGATSSRTFVVRNEGTADLAVTATTLEGADAAEFAIVTGGGAFTVVAGDSAAIEVSFAPTALGPKTAALRLASDDPDENPFDVALAGRGVQPDIAATPVSEDWGDVLLGAAASRFFVIRNEGTADLAVTATTLEGPDAVEFAIVTGGGAFTLVAGDSASIEVSFAPTALGPKSATLRLASDDPDENPLDVPLAGRGVLPDIAITPPADHGNVLVGSSVSRSFVVLNEGTAPLTVTATTILGVDAADFGIVAGGAPFTLAPAESASVDVSFSPSSLGPKTATLRVASDDPDESVLDLALAGAGVEPDVTVTPAAWDYGDVRVAATASRTFVVRNDGTADLAVTATTLQGPDAAEFAIVTGGGAFTLVPADSVTIGVDFGPTSLGPKAATLRLATDDPDEGAVDVALAGTGVDPDIAADPSSHDYGDLLLGATSSRTFVIRNEGTADLAVTATTLQGPDAAEFAIVTGGGAFTVVAGDSAAIEVSFAPTTLGPKTAALRLASDDPDENPFDVALAGRGVQPDIAATPASEDWGDVLLGASASRFFVIRNEGTADLAVTATTLEGADAGEFTVVTGGGAFALVAGDSASIEVSFAPTALGPKSATLRLASDDPDENPLDVALAGRGVLPDIAATPASRDWGDVLVGTTVSGTFVIRNEGTGPLDVTAISLAGVDAAEFDLVGAPTGFALAPAESASLTVDFHPASPGAKAATLRLVSTDPDESPLDLPLAGNGVVPDIAVDPSSWNAGDVLVGGSASHVFMVRNEGTSDLAVTATTLEGTDPAEFAIVTGGGAFTLAPADSAQIEVAFQPGSPGTKSAILRLASDDPDESPLDASLVGVGIAPDITAEPGAHDFGDLLLGSSSSRAFVIRNDGTADLVVTATTLEGTDAVDFAIASGGGAFTLAPAESASIGIDFTPGTLGPKTAALRLASDDPDENPLDVPLAGRAVLPDIAVDPSAHDWGDVRLTTSESNIFVVRNEGTADLSVTATTILGPNAAQFTIVAGGGSFLLAAAESTTVEISFAPASLGPKSATLRITSDDPDESPFDVALSATGVPETFPDITVTPTSHDYGSVFEGSTVSAFLTIRNDGTADLAVGAVTIGGPDAAEFGILSGGGPVTLVPGASSIVQAEFAPTALGAKTATLTIPSDDEDEPTVDVPLAGVCLEAPVGGGTIVHEETVTGGSSGAALVSSPNIAGSAVDLYLAAIATKARRDVVDVSGGGLTWTRVRAQCAGRNQTGIEVWMAVGPASGGVITATLASAPNSAAIAVSRYSGVDPAAPLGGVVSANTNGPGGPCSGGVDGPSYALALTTSQDGALAYGAASMRQRTHTPGAGFTERADFVQGAGGSAVGVAVEDREVTPAASVTVDGSFDRDVDWAAIAFEILPGAAADGPEIAVTPASHDYGSLVAASGSGAQTFTVRNDGNQGLTVTATTLLGPDAGDFAIVSGGGSFPVAPGGTHDVVVSFAPAAVGAKSATLRFASNDAGDNPLDVALTGTGVPPPTPDIAVSPAVSDWGNVSVGASASRAIVIRNDGTATLAVTATTLLGPDAGEFAILSGGGSFSLAPAESAAVDVSFAPTSLGPKSATLRVTSDDPDENPVDVALVGQGVPPATPDISVAPTSHDYGAVFEGASATASFTIGNDGTGDLAVSAVTLAGPDAAEFAIESGGGAFPVSPGATHDVVVRFQPGSIGAKSATLTIASDDPDESSVDVALTGTGEPAPVGGGEVVHEETVTGGSTGATVVTSAGLVGGGPDLYLAAISSKARKDVGSVSGAGLAWTRVKAQCGGRNQTGVEVWMAFGASAGGPVTATFVEAPSNGTIAVSRYSGVDPLTPIGAVVSGNTNGPDGPCAGGTDDADYSFGLTTSLDGAWIYGAASMRVRTHEPGAGFTERADFVQGSGGGAAGIAVEDRAVATAGAVVVDGTFDRAVDWAAIGLEIRPGAAADGPEIAVTPSSHDYGSLVAGAGSASFVFAVRNSGNQDLTVTATTLEGPDAVEFAIVAGGGGFTLAAGDSTTIEVSFSPATIGAKTAALRLASNDADENPLDVPLTGTGITTPEPDVAVTPASYDYGDVFEGSSASYDFVIRNEGTADLGVTATTIEGADAGDFGIVAGGGAFTLAPAGSATVEVSFAPGSLGPKAATLRVASDDPDEATVDVPLAGNGVEVPTGGGPVAFEAVDSGGVTGTASVATAAPVTAVPGQLYLASIASKSYKPVASVDGLGLTWTLVAAQCGGRNQTGVEVWRALGTPSGDGLVTATLSAAAENAVIVVARYSGVLTSDPVGTILSGNTNGVGGACSGGTDGVSYAFDFPTTVSGGVVFGAAAMRTKTHTPGGGFTQREEIHHGAGGGAASVAVMDQTVATPATVSLSGTFNKTVDWAVIGLEIKPGSGAPAGPERLADADLGQDRRTGGENAGSTLPDQDPGISSSSLRLPDAFALTRLYPNPFRGTATIEYALPARADVSIIIYDVRGRLVRTLTGGSESPGFKQVRWNGRNDSGAAVAPGIYFVRWHAQGHVATKKLILRR